MRDRGFLVSELINNPLPSPLVLEELQSYGAQCEKVLARVTRSHIFTVLKMLSEGLLSPDQVTAWAARLEGRRDLAFEFGEEGAVREVIFWLANPGIYWPVDTVLCSRIEALFERRSRDRGPTTEGRGEG